MITSGEVTPGDLLHGTPLHPEWTRELFRRARKIVLTGAALAVLVELVRPTRATWFDALLYLALAAWPLAFLFSVGWPPRARARRENGVAIVRFTPGWRHGFRALLIVPFAGIFVRMLPEVPEEPVASSLMLAFFVATCAFAIMAPREVFRLTSAGVERTSPWTGRITSLRWSEVEKFEIDGFRRVVMHGAGRKLKVSLALEGGGEYAAQALAILPASALEGGTHARALLEAAASRLTGAGRPQNASTPPHGRPATMLVLAGLLVACGVGASSDRAHRHRPVHLRRPGMRSSSRHRGSDG